MSVPTEKVGKLGKIRGVLATLRDLPGHVSGRLRNWIAGFDQKIAAFRQRRFL